MISIPYPDSDLVGEPSLEEMFAEPIVRLIMKRDGVKIADLQEEIDRVQRKHGLPETAQ